MISRSRRSLVLFLVATLALPVTYYACADPPSGTKPKPANRIVPGVPAEAAHAHNLVLRIMKVTPVEKTGKSRLLKLEVERYYGKITTASLNRAREHETMRFTILFPASPDADVRPGDLINYWLVGYTPMRGGNVADNRGIATEQLPSDGR